jgi:hypothetical protein
MSATSRAGRATPVALRGLQRVERADDLAQDLCGHLGVERGGLELLVAQQHLDHADVGLALEKVRGEAVAPIPTSE